MQKVATAAKAEKLESYDKRGNSEAERIVKLILRDAARRRADTLHIEPHATTTITRLRIDGSLRRGKPISKHLHEPIVDYLKQSADLDTTSAAPQAGSFEIKLSKQTYTIQITCIPTLIGERLVLRLSHSQKAASLENLGFWGKSLSGLGYMLAAPRGLILLSGDHGSGVYDTLESILKSLEQSYLKIARLKDSDAKNSSVDRATKLRLALRAEPDIIAIENLNNPDVFKLALEAASHSLVIGIIPATSSSSALSQALHNTDDVYSLARIFLGLIFQSSESTLCPGCRNMHKLSSTQKAIIDKKYDIALKLVPTYASEISIEPVTASFSRQSKGCKTCHSSGTLGKTASVQVNNLTPAIQKSLIDKRLSVRELDDLLKQESILPIEIDRLIKALVGRIAWQSLAA